MRLPVAGVLVTVLVALTMLGTPGAQIRSVPEVAEAPASATYLTQVAESGLSAEQTLASLSSGIMRVATTTGVVTSLTTSAGIAANLSDETGTGAVMLAANPTFTQTPVAVGALPTCEAGTANQIAVVNDSLTPALGIAVSAGGALTVGVICKSGTGWIVF